MSFKLFDYQEKAVNELIHYSKRIMETNYENKRILLKAITGSGKTVITSAYISSILEEYDDIIFIWICPSDGGLDKQSYKSLKKNLPTNINVINLQEILISKQLNPKDVLVFGWSSINKKNKKTNNAINIAMREESGEKGSLITSLKDAKNNGYKIILIIDESHDTASTDSSAELIKLINPEFRIEITATPEESKEPTSKEIASGQAGFVMINTEDVIKRGVIKKSVIINNEVESILEESSVIESLISSAIKQQELLYNMYNKEILPLILIQLPNKELGNNMKSKVLNILKQFNISYEKGIENLAIKLDEEEILYDNISDKESKIKCLIFKQSISTGWDCPRAQILVKLRNIQSETFNSQVIGRILRMPELRHYELERDLLNHAYIYTNEDNIKTDTTVYKNILPIISVIQTKYDLKNIIDDTSSLKNYMIENKYYEENPERFIELFSNQLIGLYDNANKLITNINDIEISLLSNSMISIKEIEENKGLEDASYKNYTLSHKEIEDEYNTFLKTKTLKNIDLVNNALDYLYFEKLGLEINKENIFKKQKSVLKHKDDISKCLKQSYMIVSKNIMESNIKEYNGIIIDGEIYYSKEKENHLKAYKKSIYTLTPYGKYDTEDIFQEYIDNLANVEFWIKNKDKGEKALTIPYKEHNSNIYTSFNPDYIIKFKNGQIGIYEVKSYNNIEEQSKTNYKHIALLNYIRNNNLLGDILYVNTKTGTISDSDNKIPKELKK